MINCLLSLLKYQGGSIKIFGEEMKMDSYDLKKKIGVVFQDVAVFDELTVYENIDYFCGLYISDKDIRKTYVEDAINLVSLNEFRNFRPKKLSGGLLRRLNIACGIAHKPTLLFLDEPTVAVDPQSRNNILEGIKKLNQLGTTVIYTTHYMEEVEMICNRIIILDKGDVIASGTKEELKGLIDIEEKITIELEELSEELVLEIKKLKSVLTVEKNGNNLIVTYAKGKNNLTNLVELLKEKKVAYKSIFSELPTLNDVFLELTGKELRD